LDRETASKNQQLQLDHKNKVAFNDRKFFEDATMSEQLHGITPGASKDTKEKYLGVTFLEQLLGKLVQSFKKQSGTKK
jgi:hypothetical protein